MNQFKLEKGQILNIRLNFDELLEAEYIGVLRKRSSSYGIRTKLLFKLKSGYSNIAYATVFVDPYICPDGTINLHYEIADYAKNLEELKTKLVKVPVPETVEIEVDNP
jgi:hypothetical protein